MHQTLCIDLNRSSISIFSILEVLDSDAIDIGSNEKMCYLRRKGLELLEAKNSDQKISSRRI